MLPDLYLNQLYILNEDVNIKFQEVNISNNQHKLDLLQEYLQNSKYYKNPIFFLNNIDIVTDEVLSVIDEQRNQESTIEKYKFITIKKVNKEHLNMIFKFLGFNIVYCLQLAENVFTNLKSYLLLKYDDLSNSLLENGAICRHDIFFDIVKLTITQIAKKKCHFKKYFHLAYLSVST